MNIHRIIACLCLLSSTCSLTAETPLLMTVRGARIAAEGGIALPHEHLNSFFRSTPEALHKYDVAATRIQIVDVLKDLKSRGCDLVVECTAINFGRNPQLLYEASVITGVDIIINTGYYAAANQEHVPHHAYIESAQTIASRWIAEWEMGIPGTDIRPGFIKTGVDGGPLTEVERKLVQAAAITHLRTGLSIATHVSRGSVDAAHECLSIIESAGVHPSAWVWVHAQNVNDSEVLIEAARKGVWIELDSLRDDPDRLQQHLDHLMALRDAGLLDHVLLSHDGNSAPLGRDPRPMTALFTHFIPMLQEAGLNEAEIHQLLVRNPRRAFAVKLRTNGNLPATVN